MNVNSYNRFSLPIVTGTPYSTPNNSGKPQQPNNDKVSFDQLLQQQIDTNDSVTFSKHAAQRIQQRQVDVSETSMKRLNDGVRLAKQKGLNDTLILVDHTAFIVNVKKNTVVTTVNSGESTGKVFTNIDGTVII